MDRFVDARRASSNGPPTSSSMRSANATSRSVRSSKRPRQRPGPPGRERPTDRGRTDPPAHHPRRASRRGLRSSARSGLPVTALAPHHGGGRRRWANSWHSRWDAPPTSTVPTCLAPRRGTLRFWVGIVTRNRDDPRPETIPAQIGAWLEPVPEALQVRGVDAFHDAPAGCAVQLASRGDRLE